MKQKWRILVVDDDALFRLSLVEALQAFGHVTDVDNSAAAIRLIHSRPFDILFTDLDLGQGATGIDILQTALAKQLYAVMISSSSDGASIEMAYRLGCRDFLSKRHIQKNIVKVIQKFEQSNEKDQRLSGLRERYRSNDLSVQDAISRVATPDSLDRGILITGPTGTGKSFLARLIHELHLPHAPFVHLNCAEIPESLIESELFGHVKGSFTGAHSDQKGKIQLAHNGTLFLDEIGTLPVRLQAKLLTAIEDRSFYPVGSDTRIQSDFRLISATGENLHDLLSQGLFRLDLFHRIRGINVHIPPLSERPTDIPLLVQHFLDDEGRRIVIRPDAMEALLRYPWPGNIRELKKNVGLLSRVSSGIITREDVDALLIPLRPSDTNVALSPAQRQFVEAHGLPALLRKIETEMVIETHQKNGGQIRATLKALRISSSTLYKIIKKKS